MKIRRRLYRVVGTGLFLLLLLQLQIPLVYAQSEDVAASDRLEPAVRFAQLTADDGLVQNTVTAILQDSQGFMWFGTSAGLSRYDGYRFTTYLHDPDNPNSLSHDQIRDLFEDRDGLIWIATEGGGVNRFDPQTETFSHFLPDRDNPTAIGGDRIFSIFQDSSGVMWFGGTPLTGLNRLDSQTQTFTTWRADRDDPVAFHGGGVWDFLETEDRQLWLAGDDRLARFDPITGQFTNYQMPHPNERRLWVIHQDSRGQIWGAGSEGLYRLNEAADSFEHFPVLREVNDITEDENGLFQVATLSGLYLFDPQAGETIGHFRSDPGFVDGLSSSRVTALYRDRAGLLWMGSQGGVNVYDSRQARFAYYRHKPGSQTGLAQGDIDAIHITDDNSLWLGIGPVLHRVNLLDGNINRYTLVLPQFTAAIIRAIHQDQAGDVWLGVGSHLLRFDPREETFQENSLIAEAVAGKPGPPPAIVALHEDAAGALWVAVNHNGLFHLDPQRENVELYELPRALGTPPSGVALENILRPPINNLYSDRAGKLWVSTWNGVSRFDPQTGEYDQYRLKAGTVGADGYIEAVYEAADGLIWIASRDGLIRLDADTEAVKYYTEADGLPTNYVVGILEDDSGDLWLSTKKGLSHFTPATETFRNYDVFDGLQGNDFNSRAFAQASNGRLFFGGEQGLTAFYPAHITDSAYQPPVVLADFQLFNQSVEPGDDSPLTRPIWETDSLTLTHEQNFLSLEFAVLNYAFRDRNQYRYRLEGFEDGWTETDSSRRFVTYTNLPAGNYDFRVQAMNKDGLWSEHEVSLVLRVLPPWWETSWFRVIALVAVIGLALGLSNLRNRDLKREVNKKTHALQERTQELQASEAQLRQAKEAAEAASRAKSAFLANMSHELRSPLNVILGFTQVVRRSQGLPQEVYENLGVILRSGEHLLTLINQVLDMSKIEAEQIVLNPVDFDLYRLLDDLEDMFILAADDKRLALVFDRAANLPRYVQTDEVKLRQTLINLIGNAVKFTETGSVTVRAAKVGNADSALVNLQFEVEDSGPGIPAEEMALLFQAFGQTATGRRAQEGTGLGLAISREFARLLGGDIRVKSERGQGATFTCDIQCQEVASIASEEALAGGYVTGLEPGQPHYRLLVVDDKWINRQLLVKLLQPLGFDLREAENGQEAIDVAQVFQPHLVWMDIRMPVMDGMEATVRMKALPQEQVPVIIALTASAYEDERAAIMAVCDDYLRKPFREREILDAMSRHIGVRYVYDDNGQPAPAARQAQIPLADMARALKSLSSDLVARLVEGTELGDVEIIDATILEIQQHDPALSEALSRLAQRFDYDALLGLLKEATL